LNHAINGPPPPCRCPSRASRSRRSARSALSPLDELINSLVVDVLYGEVEDGEPRRGVLRFWGKPQCPTRLRCAPTTWRTPRRPSHRASRSVEPLGLRHIVHRKAAKCLGVLEQMSVCFAASHSSVCMQHVQIPRDSSGVLSGPARSTHAVRVRRLCIHERSFACGVTRSSALSMGSG
jgi:hypothetical protein